MEKSCPGKKGQPPSRVNYMRNPFAQVKSWKQRSRKIWLRRLERIVPAEWAKEFTLHMEKSWPGKQGDPTITKASSRANLLFLL